MDEVVNEVKVRTLRKGQNACNIYIYIYIYISSTS